MPVTDAVLQQFRSALTRRAGAYLHNIIREDGVTCSVCAAPVDGYVRCAPCLQHRRSPFGGGLADAVGALTYAIDQQQSGHLMYGYKSRRPIEEHVDVVAMLVMLGLSLHTSCVGTVVGMPVTHWAVVPSLRGRAGPHPLRRLALPAAPGQELVVGAAGAVADPRSVRPANFVVPPVGPEAHVLVLDDTWTSGGHAQGCAAAVRAAGAAKVSVLAVARWIDPAWGDNETWIRRRLTQDYRPEVCPWTGQACP